MAANGNDAGIFNFPNAVPHRAIPVCKMRVRNVSIENINVIIMPHRKLTMQSLYQEHNPAKSMCFLQEFLRPNPASDKYFQLRNSAFYELFDNEWYTDWNIDRSIDALSSDEFDVCVREGLRTINKLGSRYAKSLNFVHSVTENMYSMAVPSFICVQKELHSYDLQPTEITTLSVLIIGTQLCVLHTPEIDEDPMTREIHLFGSGPTDIQTKLFIQRNTITNSGCAIFLEKNTLFVCPVFSGDYYTKLDINFLNEMGNPQNKNEDEAEMRVLLEEHIDVLIENNFYDSNQESLITDEDDDDTSEYDFHGVDIINSTPLENEQPLSDEQSVRDLNVLSDEQDDFSNLPDLPNNQIPDNENSEYMSLAFVSSDMQILHPPEDSSSAEEAANYIQSLVDEQKEEDEHERLEQWTLCVPLDSTDDDTSSNSSNTSSEIPVAPSELNIPDWLNGLQIPVITSVNGNPSTSYQSFMSNLSREEIIQLIVQTVSPPDSINSTPNTSLDSDTLETFDNLISTSQEYEIVVKEEPMSEDSS